MTKTLDTRHIFTRARRIFRELDYAQRRLLEIRTGVPMTGDAERRLGR
jgi:hypothetical protein